MGTAGVNTTRLILIKHLQYLCAFCLQIFYPLLSLLPDLACKASLSSNNIFFFLNKLSSHTVLFADRVQETCLKPDYCTV